MELLVTYDVGTTTADGERRLRRVAKICEGYDIRVQKSVFEVVCTPAERLLLQAQLLDVIAPGTDSIRIYAVPRDTFTSARHLGAATRPSHRGPMVL
jgi:CRISPR-associated protein Cas2